MRIVELEVLRDALVGVPGQSGLSVEARKRLSIAVEQVANPSVIFMDEPTSGALRTENSIPVTSGAAQGGRAWFCMFTTRV